MVSMQKTDVVIVGAGVSGLLLSLLLERRGIDYLTLERRPCVGKHDNRITNTAISQKVQFQRYC